jgi:hypothetical protein
MDVLSLSDDRLPRLQNASYDEDVRKWPIATNRGAAKFWSLMEAQRTSGGARPWLRLAGGCANLPVIA